MTTLVSATASSDAPASRLSKAWRYFRKRKKRSIALVVIFAHLAGALTSVHAIMSVRTAQGAIAWTIGLNACPYVAVPAYLVFGRTKFEGYIIKRRAGQDSSSPYIKNFTDDAAAKSLLGPGRDEPGNRMLERLTRLPATTGNHVELLRDGDEIFPSIFDGIDHAEKYLIVQFYTVRDDSLGGQLRQHLVDAARRGVKVHFIFDEIGSHGLPSAYIESLRREGIEMLPFNSMKGTTNRFQLNFRNHRKVVVADGREAWTGGANIGDEYNGGDPQLSPWHDAMVKIQGPAVQAIQVSLWEDWLWASGIPLDMDWSVRAASLDGTPTQTVRCVPSGPADKLETASLYFLQLINSSASRLWITTPYFVPDEEIVSALELAALRGVDVRILVPAKSDNFLADLSGWESVERLSKLGVWFYRYQDGFMHQKITMVDSTLAMVGSANLDNRSFRLNFELGIEVRDEAFNQRIATMFENDFAHSSQATAEELKGKGFFFALKVRSAYLLSPIQ